MKHFFLFLVALAYSVSSMAQLNGNGFYRVHNYMTKRYVYVIDDKGKLDYQASTADMDAIQLWRGFEKASCDPASICFIEKHGDKYDIQSQGTGVYHIIDSYVSIRANQDGTFYAYGTKDGITKYLSDAEKAEIDKGKMSDAGKGEYRKWYIDPIGTESNNFFGIKPSVNNGGKYYTSFYTAFPYSFASNGMKAYYIIKVVNDYAVMREIKGTVPAYTPVIVEMSSDQPINNKLNIGGSGSAICDNSLKGVFFNNPEGSHRNQTAYNASTMRLLGVAANGKLALITSNEKFIPANNAYLQVTPDTPAELTLITEEEYEQLNANKPESISLSETQITVVEGHKYQLTATVLPESAFDKSVTWVTNNADIALIDNKGMVTGVKAGVVNVTATTHNGLMASCEVVVKQPTQPDGVTLSETKVTMTVGETHKLTATVTPDNAYDKSVTWGSYDTSKATIDNDGVITAHSAGVVRVFAQSVNGIQTFCEVIVKDPVAPTGIILSETQVKMYRGHQHKLTATVTPDDAYDKSVSWGSNDKKYAVVDKNGVITALEEGVVRIVCWTVNDIKAYCEVIITREVKPSSIKMDKLSAKMKVGEKLQLTATVLPENASEKDLKWTVDDENVAKVDDNGLVTAIAAGKAVITATTVNGLKAICHVTVENPDVLATSISLDKNVYEAVEGSEFELKATILPENVSVKNVAWSSSDNETATVNEGLVKVLKEGTVTITAATADGTDLKDECIVTVLSGIYEIFADSTIFPAKVFNANGVLVKTAKNAADLKTLVPGVYLIGGKKVIIIK